MKEQLAIDFLHSKILFNIGLDDNDIFKLRELVKIAKKLEDKQHSKTWDAALDAGQNRAWNVMRAYSDFDDWYAETFGSNRSKKNDRTCTNSCSVVCGECQLLLPQQEISDEEIEKVMQPMSGMHEFYKAGFIEGAKWYREQLKNKQ